jgi:hypothetical protein
VREHSDADWDRAWLDLALSRAPTASLRRGALPGPLCAEAPSAGRELVDSGMAHPRPTQRHRSRRPRSLDPRTAGSNNTEKHVKKSGIAVSLLVALNVAACSAPTPDEEAPASDRPATTSAPDPTGSGPSTGSDTVVGTVIRFSSEDTTVDVTIGEDNPAVRDLLSMLPMTLDFEEFNGREKIAYPPGGLDWEGSPGSDPEDGDLIYFTPWGNLGFYYNAEGIDYSDQTIHLGTYDASPDQLEELEGEVSIEIAD